MTKVNRCSWVSDDVIYEEYHDTQWGVAEVDSLQLFAKLCLDGQQAGLSWITILKKEAGYRSVFYNFNPYKIAAMPEAELEKALLNPNIIRNRQKVRSIVNNANAYIALEEQGINFSDYLWGFVDGATVMNRWTDVRDVPVSTPASQAMSKQLKKDGFSFVGPTICYAFMQAVGMVNDHTLDCHRYQACCELARL